MTEVVDAREARARAARIRTGIHNYLTTLAEIAAAHAARDWVALGYADWQSYVDEEFGAERLRLPAEHRQKAVTELRLAGMSQRAIASAVGVGVGTVHRDLDSAAPNGTPAPENIMGSDGKTYPASRPGPAMPEDEPLPLGDELTVALTGVIEETASRVQDGPEWSSDELGLRAQVEDGFTVVASLRGGYANLIAWAEKEGLYVRIDRRTDWGNPFEMPGDGDRKTVIASYEYHYLPHKPSLTARLGELKGKVLGCWCYPEPCHGDILRDLADET